MTTITTTDLSWSAAWSHTPVTSDSYDYINSKHSVASSTSESSSVFNSNSNNDEIVLSKEAQSYTNNNSSQITDTTNTIQEIYNALGEIISSSTTSDSEKWNAFAAADEIRAEYMENQGIDGLDLSFNQETENSTFMQKINSAYDDINNQKLDYTNKDTASNPLATKIINLWQTEVETVGKEAVGSSSFSINIQETTIHTDNGDVTSFQLSSNLTGHSDVTLESAPEGSAPGSVIDPHSSSSSSLGIQNLSVSGKTNDLNAELDKEIVEELFSSSDKKTVKSPKNTQPNTSASTNASTPTPSLTTQNPISGPLS